MLDVTATLSQNVKCISAIQNAMYLVEVKGNIGSNTK